MRKRGRDSSRQERYQQANGARKVKFLPPFPFSSERAPAPSSQLAHHVAAKAVDDALAGERHQLHVARLPRLEPHRGAGGDIEPHAARLFAVELQRRIGLEEMVVRADLDRTVAGIGNGQCYRLAAGSKFDLAVLDE